MKHRYPISKRLQRQDPDGLLKTMGSILKTIYCFLSAARARRSTFDTQFWTAFCLLFTASLYAQYPVNANLVVGPPHSLYLTDYGLGNNLNLNLVQRDFSSVQQEVYLNIELEGAGIRLRTLPSFRPSTYIDLIPGAMLSLGNVDLAEYFNANSLSFEGLGREAFVANGQQLPEGLYKIKVRAFYRLNGAQASNEAFTLMRLQRGEPPIINQPMHKGKVWENPTQSFVISWTNRSPMAANMPSYRIQMWEMPDPTQDPNIIANSAYPPILDDHTNFSTYQYGPSNTPLTPGRHYVLRVQVLDPEGRDIYSNGGYSQVVRFTYGDPCEPPTGLAATLDPRGIALNWALAPNQGGYRLQYGRIDTAWTEVETMVNRYQLEKTYPSAQYQMRAATICGAGKQSDYSDIVYIGTSPSGPNNQAACGDPFPKIDLSNQKLLPSLSVGDKFTSFDFEVTVTKIVRNDSTSYAGEGKTPFNMLGGMEVVCYFDGIQINTDRRHINEVPLTFQQKPYVFSDKDLKQFKDDLNDTREMFTGDDAAKAEEVRVDVTIGTVVYDSTQGKIVINDAAGTAFKVLPSGKDYRITDKDGNVYLVSKDNKIAKQPKATATAVKDGGPAKGGGPSTSGIHFVQDQPILSFAAHPQQTWGFDAMEMNTMGDGLYESLRNDLETYHVPCKSVGAAASDRVLARLYANPLNVDLARMRFKTNDGLAVPYTYDSLKKEWTLTLTAGLHRNDFSVFPYYGNGKDTLCGKLNVMPLDRKEVSLVLVPLNGYRTANIKAADIEAYLNRVYRQANIGYKVSLAPAFSSPAADQPLSVEHGKLAGEYAQSQAQVIADYSMDHPEQDNTICLFLCKEGSNSAVKGHTPLNRGYGFLFGEGIDNRTIAHELGHGYPLALEHPFGEGGTTGSYSNLMDYAASTSLSFRQWGLAHNPKLKVRFGQDAKEGELNVSELEQLFDWLVKNRGKKVKYDKSVYKTYDSWNTFIKYGYDGGKSGLYVELSSSGNVDLDLKYVDVSIEKHTCGTNFIMRFLRPDRSGEFLRIWAASYSSYQVLLKRLNLQLSEVTRAEVIADYQSLIKASGKGCNEIDIIYENIPSYVLDKMRYADKVEALASLASCSVDKVCVDESRAVLNLIGSIKDTEIDQFIVELTQKKLFERLYNMMGTSDAEKLVAILTEKFYRSKSYQSNLDQVTRDNSFLYEAVTQNRGRNYKLDLAGDHYNGTYYPGGYDANGNMNQDPFKLGLFQTVLVVSKLELPYVNMARKGNGLYIAKVPAIYVKMLINRQVQSTVAQGTMMVIEAVGTAFTLYTGTGMLRAPTLLARIVGAADVASGLTGAGILTYKGIVAQKYGQNSDKYHLMEQVENIVNLYNGCRFAVELVQLPKLIEKACKLWNAEKTALKQGKVLTDAEFQKVDDLLGDGVPITANWLAKYPNIRSRLDEIASILNSAGFDRYRFENILKKSNNLRYLEENADLLPEIARKIKPKYNYTDTDVLKIFGDAVNTDFVKALLPTDFVKSLKKFGKTEEEIVTYFRNYHNVNTKGEFFTQIEQILTKNNPYGLSRDEAYALWGYTTNFFYRDLNTWLRDGTNVDKTAEIVALLKQGLGKVPKYNGTAYRALEFKADGLKIFLTKYGNEGDKVVFEDFLSAGSTKEAAFFDKPQKNVRITLEVKDAPIISPFADGIKFRGYSPEELLLNTGGKFEIVEYKIKDGIHYIRMIQIN